MAIYVWPWLKGNMAVQFLSLTAVRRRDTQLQIYASYFCRIKVRA